MGDSPDEGAKAEKKPAGCIQRSKKNKVILLPLILLVIGAIAFRVTEHPAELEAISQALFDYEDNRIKILTILDQHAEGGTEPEETLRMIEALAGDTCVGFIEPSRTTVWDLENSLIFGFTLVTTIGYGTQAPATHSGKLVVIIFGGIGMPMCVAAFGFMAKKFLVYSEYFYVKILHINLDSPHGQLMRFFLTLASLVGWFFVGAVFFKLIEGWSMANSLYFVFITLTTIGLGDFYPSSPMGQRFLLFYGSVGLGVLSVTITMGIAFGVTLMKQIDEKRKEAQQNLVHDS